MNNKALGSVRHAAFPYLLSCLLIVVLAGPASADEPPAGAGGWGQAQPADATQSKTVTSAASSTAKDDEAPAFDPLETPEALVRVLLPEQPTRPEPEPITPPQQQPDWNRMTTLQRKQAIETYQKQLAQRQQQQAEQKQADDTPLAYAGKEVRWVLWVYDIRQADATRYKIEARSSNGYAVTTYLPAENKDALAAYKRDDPILMTGTLKDYRLDTTSRPRSGKIVFMGVEHSSAMPNPTFGALLEDATIQPASEDDAKATRALVENLAHRTKEKGAIAFFGNDI